MGVYICPKETRTRYPGNDTAFTSYMGVSGTISPLGDGIFYFDSSVRFSNIHDGLSNTLMVGERPPSQLDQGIYGGWYGGWGIVQNGHAHSFLGVEDINLDIMNGCPMEPYRFGPGDRTSFCHTFHYWSHHPGGSHFLLADGSVRFLGYSAEPLMSALATRSGGEVAVVQ